MKYIQELQYDQIATVLGILRGTVMSRLYHWCTVMRWEYLKLY